MRQLEIAHPHARFLRKGKAAHLQPILSVCLRPEPFVRRKTGGHHDDEIERKLPNGGTNIGRVFTMNGVKRPTKQCDLHIVSTNTSGPENSESRLFYKK